MERVPGRFSPQLTKREKQEVMQLIHGFIEGILPRSAPHILLNRYLQRYNLNDEIMSQFIKSVPL